jgi:hypothetical protein
VTTDELLAVLNKDAARLSTRLITKRILRDWIDEGLIGVRTPKGRRRALNPVWHFSKNDAGWARRIVELKAANIRRTFELKLHLWVSEDIYPIGGIAEALNSEFIRFMHRQRRSLRFKYDHRNHRRLSEEAQEEFSRQLPPLDHDLSDANFVLPRDVALETVSKLLWGEASGARPSKTAENAAGILGELDLDNLSGMFGAPDEITRSGEEQLAFIRDEDLRQSRSRLIEVKSGLQAFQLVLSGNSDPQAEKMRTALRKAIDSFERTDWIVSTLAAFAVQAFRTRTEKGTRPAPQK